MTRRERVVAAIREARDIHQDWIDALRARDLKVKADRLVAGGVKHHQRWVGIYNATLRELGEQP